MRWKYLDYLFNDAKATYQSLFPALNVAVQLKGDGDIVNLAHRDGKSMAMWTTSTLYGTLEEVAALYLDPSGKVPMLLDSARSRRLYELVSPSTTKPLHGVTMRWSLWKPPSKLSNGRDVCFLEYMDSFVDAQTGHRVWTRSMRSINHLCCPASQHPNGPIRMNMRVSGMIFRETDRPNVLEHVTLVHIDTKNASSWVVQQAIAVNKRAAEHLNHVLKITRQLESRHDLGSDSSEADKRRECRSCGDRTSKWMIAKRCRFCDNILCKKCIDIRYHRTDASGKNHRMCLPCAAYTGSGTISHCRYQLNKAKPQPRNDMENWERVASTPNALLKRNCNELYRTQSSVCSKCSTSMTGSYESGSCGGHFAARTYVNNRISDTVNSSSARRMQSVKQEWDPNKQLFTLNVKLEPSRTTPIDLSYLAELVTGGTRCSVGIEKQESRRQHE